MSEHTYGLPNINIKTFGELSFDDGTNTYHLDLKKKGQLCTLLLYFLVNRDKSIASEELIDLIWTEEKIDNPNNALKNLIYRLRNTLDENLSNGMDFIAHKYGGYMWNDALNTFTDAEEFIHYITMSNNTNQSIDNRIKFLSKAIECYAGEFIPNIYNIPQINEMREKYLQMYKQAFLHKAELLFEVRNYNVLIEFCKKALNIFPFYEEIVQYYFLSLKIDGRLTDVLKDFETLNDYWISKSGKNLPPEIEKIYTSVQNSNESDSDALSLDAAVSSLSEEDVSGAYYCDYDSFKNFYRLQLRNTERTKTPLLLMIASAIVLNSTNVDDSKVMMNMFVNSCIESLRKGDAITKFNDSQVMILIYDAENDAADVIMERIKNKFHQFYTEEDVLIECTTQEMK